MVRFVGWDSRTETGVAIAVKAAQPLAGAETAGAGHLEAVFFAISAMPVTSGLRRSETAQCELRSDTLELGRPIR